MKRKEETAVRKPQLSTALSVAAGFSFYILCMVLPLVGPSGSRVAHAARNKATFLGVLLVTLILSAASTFFALQQQREEGTPFPRFTSGLCLLCVLIFIVVSFSGFAI